MVGYKQLDGKTGAAISVLRNINKAGFNFPEQPVWVDPRTKDAIWRGTGYNGIYLLGEGDYDRVKRAMDRQEQSIKSVTAGSQIPVYRVMVGNGQGQVPLKKLRSNIIRRKAYRPTHHKNALLAKIHPRERFILTKAELEKLNARLRTLQTKNGMGIPKGIDPTRMHTSAAARCEAADLRRATSRRTGIIHTSGKPPRDIAAGAFPYPAGSRPTTVRPSTT